MPFDLTKFAAADFTARTEDVPVPDLAPFFGDGDPAVWTVRGLTGAELARVNEATDAAKNLEALAEALASPAGREKAGALRSLLGLADGAGADVPQDLVKRIEMLRAGSVAPVADRQLAVRLADVYPVEFYQLTNAITRLTGQGKILGKPAGSGETPESEPR